MPLLHPNFFTQDMSGVGPKDGFDNGGVLHAIVGTLIELGIALAITLPLGIGTAVFMTEVGGRFARVVRTVVEAMTALPSIVAGLFIYSVFIVALGQPRSGLAASLAIAVMMLPIIARAADVVLRVVPGGLREASLALGASRWRTVWHVVLPTARPGLATAVILGVARGVGETSPVLLTSGAAAFMVTNPTDGVDELAAAVHLLHRPQRRADGDRARVRRRHRAARPRPRPLRHRPAAGPPRRSNSRRMRSRRGRTPSQSWAEDAVVDLVDADPLVEMGPVQPSDPAHDTYPTDPTRESL